MNAVTKGQRRARKNAKRISRKRRMLRGEGRRRFA